MGLHAEWTQLVKRRFGDRKVAGLQPEHGTGRSPGSHGRRGARGRGGPGDELAARQGRLAAQPSGVCGPWRTEARDGHGQRGHRRAEGPLHPLGDTVEASGVGLRGMGRVRQGFCPFHDEAEGSFTVYADSERWYCFGCGLGGDVLDFIRRVGEPDACRRPSRGWTAAPGLRPGPPIVQPERGVRSPPRCLSRDPALLTAAARFYAGQLRRDPAAREYLTSRGIGLDAATRLGLGYSPGHGLRQALGVGRLHRKEAQ